jgi:hypothetical protein
MPHGIAVDSSGNVYVIDTWNKNIQKFDSNGVFITKWGSNGSADGQFNGPSGIAADSSGSVYVIDAGKNRIQVFSLTQNQMSNSNSSNGYPNLNTTSSMPTPTGIISKNITLMINNQTKSLIIPQNKTSIATQNITSTNTKNKTSPLPPQHAGISDQF